MPGAGDGVGDIYSGGEQPRGDRPDSRGILEFDFECAPVERGDELRAGPQRNEALDRRAFEDRADLCKLLSECRIAQSIVADGISGNSGDTRTTIARMGGKRLA